MEFHPSDGQGNQAQKWTQLHKRHYWKDPKKIQGGGLDVEWISLSRIIEIVKDQ